jgi:hypothetical protein
MARKILDTTLFTGRIQRAPASLDSQVRPVGPASGAAVRGRGPQIGVPFLLKSLSRPEKIEKLRASIAKAKETGTAQGRLKLGSVTNLEVYVNAYNGALAGMAGCRLHSGLTLDKYVAISVTSGSWAQAFDETWGSATALDEVEAELILLCSFGYWNGRSANTGGFLQIGGVIASIIDVMGAAEIWFEGEGISPPPWNS